MNSYSQDIQTDIDAFQDCVQRLSSGVASAGTLWQDAQYASLASGISALAMRSRDVLVTGDRVCESINIFFWFYHVY